MSAPALTAAFAPGWRPPSGSRSRSTSRPSASAAWRSRRTPHAAARDPIAAIHDAGRGQWALAIYQGPVDRWTEILPPTLCSPDELLAAARLRVSDGILCGEVATLPPDLLANLHAAGLRAGGSAAGLRRAALLAELGWRRRQAGGDFLPARLAPIYLREPAIGPQPQPVRPRKEQG